MRHKNESIVAKLAMSDEIRRQLTKVVRSKSVDVKGYRFKKDIDNNRIIAFDCYRYKERTEGLLRTAALAFRFLSIHGHPSYLGVFQFGQTFNNDSDKDFLRTILTCAYK